MEKNFIYEFDFYINEFLDSNSDISLKNDIVLKILKNLNVNEIKVLIKFLIKKIKQEKCIELYDFIFKLENAIEKKIYGLDVPNLKIIGGSIKKIIGEKKIEYNLKVINIEFIENNICRLDLQGQRRFCKKENEYINCTIILNFFSDKSVFIYDEFGKGIGEILIQNKNTPIHKKILFKKQGVVIDIKMLFESSF